MCLRQRSVSTGFLPAEGSLWQTQATRCDVCMKRNSYHVDAAIWSTLSLLLAVPTPRNPRFSNHRWLDDCLKADNSLNTNYCAGKQIRDFFLFIIGSEVNIYVHIQCWYFVILVEEEEKNNCVALLFNLFGICFIRMVLCRICWSLLCTLRPEVSEDEQFVLIVFFLFSFWHYWKCLNSMAFDIDPTLVLMLHD